MAITIEIIIGKVEVVGSWNVQVATDTVLKEDGVEISRSRHRHVLVPFGTTGNSSDGWTHTATDISKEDSSVQAICNAVWTQEVKDAWTAYQASSSPTP